MLRYFLLLCNKMISDTYKYDSVTVANYIIAFANQNKFFINMTKLQKLLDRKSTRLNASHIEESRMPSSA